MVEKQTQERTVTLKVAEAATRDVGRGIARVDPKDMERAGAEVGDIIEIAGKRSTAVKIMPAFPEHRGKRAIQIDGIIRGNAQVGIDEKIAIRRIEAAEARQIVLSPATIAAGRPSGDTRYLGRLLEGLPVTRGDTVRAMLFGTRRQDFEVRQTVPEGVVLVHPTTQITVEDEKEGPSTSPKISYEDVGGLPREIRRVREMIELPLKYPQLFHRLGIDPPKGVLLHGPPGCGKTLIARAVANETDARFIHVNGPEIMAKFYGESEGKLRAIFESAREKAPCIVFLDEIDAISPKREEMGGERQMERRIVAQLLALMDGLEARGEVIVIGATNIPNVIDPALRRPGRFDREIEIGIPDQNGREKILQIHTRGMPLAEDVSHKRLAEITHGFVGADLEALAREAAMACIRTIFPTLDLEHDELPYERIMELEVTMDHFIEAMKEVQPSAMREVFVEVPNVAWEDVGGLDDLKRELKEAVEWPLKHADLFERARTRPPKGILLSGPPGVGKTLLVKALAHASGVNFISVKGPELVSKWIGESEKGVREVFRKAKQASPCIVFFDEIDSLAPSRGGQGDSGVTQRIVSQFLAEMDGVEELKGVVVLAATNRRDMVDPALLRTGRFDLLLRIPIPDEAARRAILDVHLRGKPLAKDVDAGTMAGRSDGLVGSDLEAVCQKASLLAIREFLEAAGSAKFLIHRRHFDAAFEIISPAEES